MKTLLEGINFFKSNLFPKRNSRNGNGSKHNDELELHIKQLEEQILNRKEESKNNIIDILFSFKNRPLREINVTYPIVPDQFARIAYDSNTEELVYIPVEPVLDDGKEREIFRLIKGIFESELNVESVQTSRSTYIEKKIAEIIDLYGIQAGKDTQIGRAHV